MRKRLLYPSYNNTPNVITMLDSIGDDGLVMMMLNISSATIKKWRKQGSCPRSSHYAIYWVTMWGQSTLESQASRDAAMAHLNSTAMHRENERLKRQLALLERRLQAVDSAANSPLLGYGA